MQRTFVNPMRGDPAPRFTAATVSNPRYTFDNVAGRSVVLCFLRLGQPAARLRLFGVTIDPKDKDDEAAAKIRMPNNRFLDASVGAYKGA